MAKDISDENSVGTADRGGHTIYLGGLIALFGFLFLIYTLSSILWPQIFEENAVKSGVSSGEWQWKTAAFMGMVAATIAALFSLFNFSIRGRWEYLRSGGWLFSYKTPLMLIAIAGTISSIWLVAQILQQDHQHQTDMQQSFYALELPVPVAAAPKAAARDDDDAGGNQPSGHKAQGVKAERPETTKSGEETGSDKKKAGTTTLTWSVPAYHQGSHDGILLMALSALLIVGFGIIYRHLSLSGGDKDGVGLLEKMIVPILSTLAFGAGVAENSEAKQMTADVKLAREGGVKIYGMSNKGRQAYLAALDRFSAAGRRDLVASLDRLRGEIAEKQFDYAFTGKGGEKGAWRNGLGRQIAILQNQIAHHGHNLPVRYEQNVDFTGLEKAIADNGKTLDGGLENIDQRLVENGLATQNIATSLGAMDKNMQRQACRLAKTLVATYSNNGRRASTTAERREARNQRDILERIWLGIKGESQGEKDRATEAETYLASLGNARMTLQDIEDIDTECGIIVRYSLNHPAVR
ncbi:MAG: hypothetical protein V3V15_10150 [Sphingorhabdus sp.]